MDVWWNNHFLNKDLESSNWKKPFINRCFRFQVHIDDMIILMYIYFYGSYLHAYITFNLRAVTSFKTALGDSMSKGFERRATKCILHSWPRGHGLSSRLQIAIQQNRHCLPAPWALPEISRVHVPGFSGYQPMNQTLLFFAAARLVGQDAPGTLHQEVFPFRQWKRSVAYGCILCYPPRN